MTTIKEKMKRGAKIGAIVGALIGAYIGFTIPLDEEPAAEESHYSDAEKASFNAIMDSEEFSGAVVESIPEEPSFIDGEEMTIIDNLEELCSGIPNAVTVIPSYRNGYRAAIVAGDEVLVKKLAKSLPFATQEYYCETTY